MYIIHDIYLLYRPSHANAHTYVHACSNTYSKYITNLGLPYFDAKSVGAYGTGFHGVGVFYVGAPDVGAQSVGAPGVGALDAGAHVVGAHNFGAHALQNISIMWYPRSD